MSTTVSERGGRVRRVQWVELSCIMCGEWAATLEGGSVLRPRMAGSARIEAGKRIVCGRCGGVLSPTDRGERVTYL